MAFTPVQLAAAKAAQDAAAHDPAPQIRLLAGPGTGKSFSIGERIKWLIDRGVSPDTIWAISFTNASTEDLREGIEKYCAAVSKIEQLRISTLHSLALTLLAKGGKLTIFPASPRVLDEWEQRHVFDEELAADRGCGIRRSRELRAHFEAKWSTGAPPLPFISAPTQPIGAGEEAGFLSFYNNTTQTYCCLLPGEAVRKCVDYVRAGTLDPLQLTGMTHLIVDEYQDLNPADVQFIDLIAKSGVKIFVCGDDDQSIYSFRYAYPTGIQDFQKRHAGAASHTLTSCFRCGENVLLAATSLIARFPSPNRLPKTLQSVYAQSAPPVAGQVIGAQLATDQDEAAFVAASIKCLITAGVSPEDILVLISSRQVQLGTLTGALTAENISADIHKDVNLADPPAIRFAYAMLRLMADPEDYLALRTVLGLKSGIGLGTCIKMARICVAHGLNFADQFTPKRSAHLFSGREIQALNAAAATMAVTQSWSGGETLRTRRAEIDALIKANLPASAVPEWNRLADAIPADITLGELLGILAARTQRHSRAIVKEVYERLALPLPTGLNPAGRIRVMTLHACKGLSAKIVFIPGLEDQLLPGQYRSRFPAQVDEAARLLYVGLTRARALTVVTFSNVRTINGSRSKHQGSRFLPSLNVKFPRRSSLTPTEVTQALADIAAL